MRFPDFDNCLRAVAGCVLSSTFSVNCGAARGVMRGDPSMRDTSSSVVGAPFWERTAKTFLVHGHMTEFTPEFVWRLHDTALFTRLPAGGCRAARDPKPISYPRADDIAQECTLPFEPANDIVAIGFCNCARIHLHGNMGGRRYEVLCRDENSDSRSPPTSVLHVGAFDPYFSHWQHGIINTLPMLGMAAPVLHAFPGVSIVVNTRSTPSGSNGLLALPNLNLTVALPGVRTVSFQEAMSAGVEHGCRAGSVPRFAYPFGLSSRAHASNMSSSSEEERGWGAGWIDVYPRHAYWPYFEAIQGGAANGMGESGTGGRGAVAGARVVFISREPPMPRALADERRVLAELRELPWASRGLSFERLNRTWPASAFGELAGLIGVHGAAMGNAYRMPPASRMIEIIPSRRPRLCYAAVATGRGVHYHSFVASVFPADMERKTTGRSGEAAGGGAVHLNRTAFVAYVRRVFKLGE
jgi:hypothetical protein